MHQVNVGELHAWLTDAERAAPQLLDVREHWEYELCAIAGSLHVPMSTVHARLHEIDRDRDCVVICHHGARSMYVCGALEQAGFERMINLTGGIDAWAREIDPSMKRY